MKVRYRKFEHYNMTSCTSYDVGPEADDKPAKEQLKRPRRCAVMEFLATLDPADVYGVVEENPMGQPSATTVYYRVKEPQNV
jgi:hypothetical protein